jgi:tagaturonate reductase
LKPLNRINTNLPTSRPIRVIQFGEGNFLRAFVDYALHVLNRDTAFDGSVAVVQPIPNGLVDLLESQDGLYTLLQKGVTKGEIIDNQDVIDVIEKCINPYKQITAYEQLAKLDTLEFVFSNTTEAGIRYDEKDTYDGNPPNTFPGKLTLLLHKRFEYFNGAVSKGLTIIPCELINNNADALKECVLSYAALWSLGADFIDWIHKANQFHNTLVDRIVPGYPKNEASTLCQQFGYEDKLIVSAESFFLWVVEADEALKEKLPFDKTAINVKFVQSIQPYRTRKVRILNGIHTSMVPFCYLHGLRTVKESIDDDFASQFIKGMMHTEIIPSIDMDKNELEGYAEEVFDRFRNPFIVHKLESIALNSISKFKVRVLPSLLSYFEKYHQLPSYSSLALASLIVFYRGTFQGHKLPVQDAPDIVEFFENAWENFDDDQLVSAVLSNESFWDMDLTTIDGLATLVSQMVGVIKNQGIKTAFNQFIQ